MITMMIMMMMGIIMTMMMVMMIMMMGAIKTTMMMMTMIMMINATTYQVSIGPTTGDELFDLRYLCLLLVIQLDLQK